MIPAAASARLFYGKEEVVAEEQKAGSVVSRQKCKGDYDFYR